MQQVELPLALYIHFPWCIQKCPYCDFNSHALNIELPEKAYIQKLLQDIEQDLNQYHSQLNNRKIISIFMGGGTPSLFSPDAINELLKAIQKLIAFKHPSIEITLEANPGTIEQSKFEGFKQAGINRLSIGIQSFQQHQLKKLGRIHDHTAAIKAAEMAKNAGFTNFNLDLMHGLPDQVFTDAINDIQTALSFLPPHLSYYQLTLEPNTLFYQYPPVLPEEDLLEKIETQAKHLLVQHHYQQYEISAFCQKGFECHHNVNYWEFGDYLGIGAGAHGKITNNQSGEIIRTVKTKHPKNYLHANQQSLMLSSEIVEKNKIPFEFMLNTLRLCKPIPWQLFHERTFLSKEILLPALEKLKQQKLMEYNENNFYPTPLGRKFLNTLHTEFL
jgi:putative oxygen-independent coproporphyrinogen III oxidase